MLIALDVLNGVGISSHTFGVLVANHTFQSCPESQWNVTYRNKQRSYTKTVNYFVQPLQAGIYHCHLHPLQAANSVAILGL